MSESNMFASIEDIKAGGFEGFSTVSELVASSFGHIPSEVGVYMALWPFSGRPRFLERGPVEIYKGGPGYYPVSRLEDEWVDDALVVYIGKTEAKKGLRGRIRAYLRWRRGQLGHSGGKAVWQIDGNEGLVFCWRAGKVINGETPYNTETALMKRIADKYGRVPFANMNEKGVI